MSDLISRQVAIDEFYEMACDIDHLCTVSDYVEFLESMTSEQPAPRWIPCGERLPEDGRVVLWCNERGSVFATAITARKGESWAVGKRHRRSKVIAWMPLPEPYEEGGGEDE